ncbi:hypothetical protein [Pontibacter pudoricolor]|uniref:hypothetical protein n=1 Tax=Pontibacter pudoricolor TaxID=2694930 RepID=UPI00139081EE|nr:hypothetical protein [Pontibacter pudoricolor]
MSFIYILSFLLLAGAGAGPATINNNLNAHAALDSGLSVQAQDTLLHASKTEKKKKKKSAKKVETKSSKVLLKRNVQRVMLTKKGEEGNHVEVVVMDGGMPVRNLEDLQMIGSSGSSTALSNFQGFDNYSLPFEGYIKYRSVNKMGSVVYDREVRFVMNEPGKWVLRIDQ